MKTLLVMAAATAAVALAAAACSSGVNSGSGSPTASATPTAGAFTLNNGEYTYDVTSDPVNTCWEPPQTAITIPMFIGLNVSTSGNVVTVVSTGGSTSLAPVVLTRSGNALTGNTNVNIPLASQGITCTLNVVAQSTGTITGDNTFQATTAATVTEVVGTNSGCGVLIGSVNANQFTQIPCNLTLSGVISKD